MGDSEISGIEIEGNIALDDNWTLTGTLGMADSEFNDYQYNFVSAFAKYSQMAGNTMPRYPEDMGSLSASYKNTMNNGWDMFFRADLNYFGETYADESNLATCDSYTLMNARGGIQRDNLRMELYVNNVTDEEARKNIQKNHIDGPLGVRGRNSNNDLIREKLGWDYSQTLEEGIRKTYTWIEEQIAKQ